MGLPPSRLGVICDMDTVFADDIVSDHSDIGERRRGVARRAPMDETREIRIGAHDDFLSVRNLTLARRCRLIPDPSPPNGRWEYRRPTARHNEESSPKPALFPGK
jgi:hypothetical protein